MKATNRVGEEHYPEPREGGVKRARFELENLGVRLDESQSRTPIGGAPGELQHCGRQIDAKYRTVRFDRTGEIQRRLTTPTANVQNALARSRREGRNGAPTQRGKLSFEGFADFRPRANPHFVRSERG